MAISEWQSVVRWAECDAAGIIYHARVFDWFSEGRITWLKNHGLDYYEVLRPQGIELLVKSANAAFHHTLHPGDTVRLSVALETVTPTRAVFHYRVAAPSAPELVAIEGVTEHAFVIGGRARRLDRAAPQILEQWQRSLRVGAC
ncbi:acyl-CoA thioesterase [Sulfobacillus harzensis]|uniref:Acyl-CoA thioesterase n=1 Tax=Sulfobacillus harzensis TaxID=2729629 RepID=A0A7Y0L624_9FIRM|nr:thioesterase family protein [Sulfobacillus harzensis]NMP23617.1 acyl-CoA thioesterase [Sulfobacillus harzensis]